MSTQRGGFKSGNGPGKDNFYYGTVYDDQIKGSKTEQDTIDGLGGDDVIIGFAGTDTLEGGTGADDISGGSDNDRLVGAEWNQASDGDNIIEIGEWRLTNDGADSDPSNDIYTFYREFTQDNDADDYVASGSFAANGTDTIYGYDENLDVIEVNALEAVVLNLDMSDNMIIDGSVSAQDLIDGGYVSFANGALKIDLAGGAGPLDTWFNVLVDDSGLENLEETFPLQTAPEWSNAGQVTVQIGSYNFVFVDSSIT